MTVLRSTTLIILVGTGQTVRQVETIQSPISLLYKLYVCISITCQGSWIPGILRPQFQFQPLEKGAAMHVKYVSLPHLEALG